jgi:hypothetical protein
LANDDGERRAFADDALDEQSAAVPVHDMLDDRKSKSRAFTLGAIVALDAIEALGQSRQMPPRNASAVIFDAHKYERPGGRRRRKQSDPPRFRPSASGDFDGFVARLCCTKLEPDSSPVR